MDFNSKSIDQYINSLRRSGLSNDQITEQLRLKGFDAYEPPVSGKIDQNTYQKWRRASLASGAELSSDTPMINREKNVEKANSKSGNPWLTKQRLLANDLKFEKINKQATENLYNEMPDVRGQFGRGQIGAMAGALVPIAAAYAIEKSHGSLNPISIPSAGEGSDVIPEGERGRSLSQEDIARRKLLMNKVM